MWHRFQPALRDAVLHALHRAGRDGRARAEASDLRDAIAAQAANSTQDDTAGTTPATEFAPSAIAALEVAYELAADAGVKQITTDDVLVGLGDRRSNGHVTAVTEVAPEDEELRRFKIYEELSAIHPGFSVDPYPLYARMRQQEKPIRRDPILPVWVATGYDEVMAILRDPRFTVQRKSSRTSSNAFTIDVLPEGRVRAQLGVLAGVLAKKMIFLDAPEHTRVRNLMNAAFTPRAVEAMRPRIQRMADDLLDAAMAKGSIDLILDFALQLPIIVICEMIGFPPADRDQLKKWADAVSHVLALGCTMRQEVDARRAMIEMRAYFDDILENLRKQPGDNLLSTLMKSGYPANENDQMELFSNCVFLLGAGHETTTSTIGNGFRILLAHRGEFEKLRADPKLIAGAVEELLRFESPVQWTSRQAKEDVEVGGIKIEAGESVLISLGAANRDPRQFADPDRLDVTRKDAHRHLAFSGGIHFCLGAALSRVEAQVGIGTLLRRLPNLKIDTEQPLRWKSGSTIRTLESLPAAF
jgi:cytochrome P450